MNFGRQRSGSVGDRPGAVLKGQEEAVKGGSVYGAFFGQSSLARMALVNESSCVKVPDDTDLETLAPLGCGLMTGAGAVINRLKPTPDSSIAIYGLGAVGMSGILASAYLGVSTIIAIDLVPSRLETALEFGATHALNASDPDIVAKVRELTRHAAGTEYTLEASGNMRAFRTAYEATAPGGHMTSAGTPGPGVKPAFDVFEHVCTAKIYSAVLMGCCYPREVRISPFCRFTIKLIRTLNQFIPFLIDLHRHGKFPIEKICKKYTVEQFQEAVHAMQVDFAFRNALRTDLTSASFQGIWGGDQAYYRFRVTIVLPV
ncbi:hypothetical protein QFC19_003736 [Naganishia cerealis]|uniref:Uncharacterized protein n=1 Tax=Naganishia cerealis TaxID=610337 RepID=A0ACC2W1L1_9TREE|nr:hypothetical protein QFC19_003736 [Naganishia cerealis]